MALGVDPDDLLRDVSKPRLRRRHDARTVLVRLFVGHDRADITRVGELLDRRDRVGNGQLVVVRDWQLRGVQYAPGRTSGVQRIGGLVRAFAAGDLFGAL
jgi:hypothetical protein